MGDIGLDLQGRKPADGHAVDVIIDTINRFPNEIELITIGPLTNVAIALLKAPEIAQKVKNCIIMGGVGKGSGNITSVSEYNIWADPEAASIVFHSGLPIKMVGWDVTLNHATFNMDDAATIKNFKTPLSDFVVDIQKTVIEFTERTRGEKAFHLPDPIAMAVALDESVATESQKVYIDIALNHDATRGQTMVDYPNVYGKTANVEVVLAASRERFLEILYGSIR
jgi:purine nucleosidase